ncbi:cation transporter [Aquimarina sp. U1-2]|uniref:heavy-metal-associated domain-containing protein n=1 Tax=Aquimarina sp. U1-2 TaxID=2823141 RepID=UPI001AEC8B09|nr:heavy metal-associated domain-containing protein [Aquimarina sp. U1-2]MBP2832933.1 cation transporter [Aquimarina sp. U1-2]
MKHTYAISGMTCNGCKATVKDNLRALAHVTHVVVDLDNASAEITMAKPISIEKLQSALPEKYRIIGKEDVDKQALYQTSHHTEANDKSKLQQLKPLLLIIFGITTASVLLHYKDWSWSAFMLDFMGLFFVIFSFFKLLDLNGFPDSFRMYDPLAKQVYVYGWIYPFIEIGLGIMFLMRFQIKVALVITLVILSITTIGVTKTLLDKKSIRCACLGTALQLPMTEATFIENAIMIIMAILMMIYL